MLTELDHVGIAVDDLEEAVRLYRDGLGMSEQHRETVAAQGVHMVLLEVGGSHVELMAPVDSTSSVARFLERSGPGLHHVAYRTADIDAELARLRAAGVRLIDDQPQVGIRGSRIAFTRPKSTGGVLTELVEPAAGH